jgi:hypothetical protein
VNEAVGLFGASAAAFEFVPEGGSHRSGPAGWEWSVPERLRREALAHGDWVRDASCQTVVIPLVLEHTPVAYFGFRGTAVSDTVLTAISRQLLMTLGLCWQARNCFVWRARFRWACSQRNSRLSLLCPRLMCLPS